MMMILKMGDRKLCRQGKTLKKMKAAAKRSLRKKQNLSKLPKNTLLRL
jgi:hypothetical protein